MRTRVRSRRTHKHDGVATSTAIAGEHLLGKDNAGIRQRQRAEEETSERERTVLWGDGWFIKLCYYYLFISRLFAGHVGARWLGLREGKVKP